MSASVHTTTRPLACWVPIRRAVPAPWLRGSTMMRSPGGASSGSRGPSVEPSSTQISSKASPAPSRAARIRLSSNSIWSRSLKHGNTTLTSRLAVATSDGYLSGSPTGRDDRRQARLPGDPLHRKAAAEKMAGEGTADPPCHPGRGAGGHAALLVLPVDGSQRSAHGTRPAADRRLASSRSSREWSVNAVPKPSEAVDGDGDTGGGGRRLRRCAATPHLAR